VRGSKIKSLGQLQRICSDLRSKGKKIGLITGCFDVIHIGHIRLFRQAKARLDVLVVGVTLPVDI